MKTPNPKGRMIFVMFFVCHNGSKTDILVTRRGGYIGLPGGRIRGWEYQDRCAQRILSSAVEIKALGELTFLTAEECIWDNQKAILDIYHLRHAIVHERTESFFCNVMQENQLFDVTIHAYRKYLEENPKFAVIPHK